MWTLALVLLAAASVQAKAPCDCLDIAFLLDDSGSVESQFRIETNFLIKFINIFEIPHPDDVQFSLTVFADEGKKLFCFGEKDQDSATTFLSTLPLTGGNTNLHLGLNTVRDVVFQPGCGDRDSSRCADILIIVTDGDLNTANNEALALAAAEELKQNGVVIITVGVRPTFSDRILLQQIASQGSEGQSFFIPVDDYSDLFGHLTEIRTMACDCDIGNPSCATCCCGELFGHKKNPCPDRKSHCCGKEKYDPYKATCCNGRLFPGFSEKFTECCDGQPYDPNYFTCCHGYIVPATRSQDQCCGEYLAYNQKFQICCGENVFRKSRHARCCGDEAFDPKLEICCAYKLSPGCTSDFRCCGSRAYDPKEDVCCDPKRGQLQFNPSRKEFCGKDEEFKCPLAKKTWNPTHLTCCCDQVIYGAPEPHSGCCDGAVINLNEQLCCNGVIVNQDPSLYECCGTQAFDPWEETCCDSYTVVPRKGICCGKDVFNHRTQICCDGYVFNGAPHRTKCCYDYDYYPAPYNFKNELCCNGYVQPGGRHYRCCGYYSYNLRTEICCYGRIFRRSLYRKTGICENLFENRFSIPSPFAANDESATVAPAAAEEAAPTTAAAAEEAAAAE